MAKIDWDYLKYWQLWHHHFDDADLELIRELGEPGGKEILEVGCGDGRLTFKLAQDCRRITGVDLEPRFIAVANEKLAAGNHENIGFAQMNAEQLEFDDSSLDLVLCPWVLQMVGNPNKAVAEAHRVLKPGGRLIVIGLRTDADYDRIIEEFSSQAYNIDPVAIYEKPIGNAFGGVELKIAPERGQDFNYYFDNLEVAHDAFLFALDYWYGTTLDDEQKSRLRDRLESYVNGERIRLRFPASIYTARKI